MVGFGFQCVGTRKVNECGVDTFGYTRFNETKSIEARRQTSRCGVDVRQVGL